MTVSQEKILSSSSIEMQNASRDELIKHAHSLRENIELLPDVDSAVAHLIDATRESHEQGAASAIEEVTADIVGAEYIIDSEDSSDAAAALDREPVAALSETLKVIESEYGVNAVENVIAHIEASSTNLVDSEDSSQKAIDNFNLQHQLSGRVEVVNPFSNPDKYHEKQSHDAIKQFIDMNNMQALADYMLQNEISTEEATLLLETFSDLIVRRSKAWDPEEGISLSNEENVVISSLGQRIQRPRSEADLKVIADYIDICNTESVNTQLRFSEISASDPELIKKVTELLYEKKAYADLITNSEELGADQQEIIDVLVSLEEHILLLSNLYYLDPGLNYTGLYEQLIKHKQYSEIFWHKGYFPSLDIQVIYDKVKDDPDQLYLIARNPELLAMVSDRTDFLLHCIDERWISILEDEGIFNGADMSVIISKLEANHEYDSLITLAIRQPELGIDHVSYYELCAQKNPYALLSMFGEGEIAISSEEMYRLLFENGNEVMLLQYAYRFTPEQCAQAVSNSLKPGSVHYVLSNLQNPNARLATLEINAYVKDALRAGCFDDVQRSRQYIPSIGDDAIVELLSEVGRAHEAIELVKDDAPEELRKQVHQEIIQVIESGSFHGEIGFSRINDYVQDHLTPLQVPDSLKLTNRFMSAGATLAGFTIVQELSKNELSSSALELGIGDVGIKGLEQFGARCREMVSKALAVEIDDAFVDQLTKSELFMSIVAKVYRVDVAEFGGVTEDGVRFSLERFKELKADGMIESLPDGYDVLSTDVMTLDGSKNREIAVDARNRYSVLRNDIMESISMFDQEHVIARQVDRLGVKIQTIHGELSEVAFGLEAADQDDKKAYFTVKNAKDKLIKIERIIDEVKHGAHIGDNFALRSPESMSRAFELLSDFSELDGELRKLVFSWAVRNDPVKRDQLLRLPEQPTIEDLSEVRSFIEQTVNQETFGNYFSDKKLAAKFRKMTSVKALDDALVRHQQVSNSEGKRAFTLVPTRGFAMELSGQVSDACWAGQYESIAAEFPNLTSVIMKRGEKGSKDERLVGAMVMIETTDENGEGVLVMRGINPIENFINKVRVEDFYRICTEYCRDTAAKRGLKPAIVISEQSGQSGTNRPVLHDFMQKVQNGMQKLKVDPENSTFNGYDISNLTYAL